MIIDLEREMLISENLSYFENSLVGFSARHFFIEAMMCTKPQPALFLAGLTCLIHGIEGALNSAIYEIQTGTKIREDHPMDAGNHKNLNNKTLRIADKEGFNVEVLAFPEEKGTMTKKIHDNNHDVGIVHFRNEFSHGKAYRATENFGSILVSDSFLLAPHFRELLTLSYAFVEEIDRFRGEGLTRPFPRNPFDY